MADEETVAEVPFDPERSVAEIGASLEGKITVTDEGEFQVTEPEKTTEETPAETKPAETGVPPENKTAVSENPELDAELNKLQLPAHAQKSTREQFDTVKQLVRTKDKAHRTELAALRAELDTAKKGGAGTLDENTKKEIEELRSFRALYAYRETPEFREKYEKPVEAARDVILRRLSRAGMSAEDLAGAKELLTKRGVRGIDWAKQLEDLTDEYTKTELRRAVEAMSDAEEDRAGAVNEAEANKEKLLASLKTADTGKQAEVISQADQFAVDLLTQRKVIGMYDVAKLPKEDQEMATMLNEAQKTAQGVYDELIKNPFSKDALGRMLYATVIAHRQDAIIKFYQKQIAGLTTKIAGFETKAGAERKARSAPAGAPGGGLPGGNKAPAMPTEEVSFDQMVPSYFQ